MFSSCQSTVVKMHNTVNDRWLLKTISKLKKRTKTKGEEERATMQMKKCYTWNAKVAF